MAGAGAIQLGEELERRLARALDPLGPVRGNGRLVSVAVPLPAALDPVELAFASRQAGEQLFCLVQPERGLALAGLGCAAAVDGQGEGRFRDCARRWERLAAEAVTLTPERAPDLPLPLVVGGFAFSARGARSVGWEGFGCASLVVPAIVVAALPGEQRPLLCLSAWVEPGVRPAAALAPLLARASALKRRPLGVLDPLPSAAARVESALAPEHYEGAVQRARELIGAGRARKLVVAREVVVRAARPYDLPALFGALRDGFPSCFCFCVGRGQAALVGASPELLVRRDGQRLTTLALAGSTRRSADPAVDAHLGERILRSPSHREEHGIVVERIVRELERRSLWVTAPSEPSLVKVANIQHLATPLRAQLPEPRSVIELAGWLHPTPAVGGEPREAAFELIPQLEGFDRGWYTGPLGWCNGAGEGEFCVVLRCALVRGDEARCFAGNGIVRDSDPAAELAETEVKLEALLPLLAA